MSKSKDPAFLWYPGDYIAGTTEFTFEEKGAYVEILMKQFEHGGPLPEEKIKRILREKFSTIWPAICEKFKRDENGHFYNDRLEKERSKRKTFTESRRNNLKGKNKSHTEPHMAIHTERRMENENENEIVNEIRDSIEKQIENVARETKPKPLEQDQFEPLTEPWFENIFDELYLEQKAITYKDHNIKDQLAKFKSKVRGAPTDYIYRDTPGIRNAFDYQLRNTKPDKKYAGTKRTLTETSPTPGTDYTERF